MSDVAQARIVAKNRIVAQTRIVALRPLTDHQGVFSSVLTKMLLIFFIRTNADGSCSCVRTDMDAPGYFARKKAC